MRYMRVKDLKPGMVVAKTVFNLQGSILLNTGVELTARFIRRLNQFGIPGIYVIDELVDHLPVDEPISDRTRREAMSALDDFSGRVIEGGRVETDRIRGAVESMISEILADPTVIINLKDIRAFDDYTFGHSVQVTVLALLTGVELGYNQYQLYELGMGTLLHDLGKMEIPLEILNKPGQLSEEEFALVKEHPERGFDLLRQVEGMSLKSAHVAFQHHERINGNGYPRGLKRERIHDYGKIAAIVDVYDAMTADRVYSDGVKPHEAVQILRRLSGFQFEAGFVEAFLKHIAVYPIGTRVVLNNRFTGVVVDVNREEIGRPVVRILEKAENDGLEGSEVDLMTDEGFFITEVMEPSERGG